MTVDLDLCYLPAREQLAKFRSGELSPVEALQAQIERAAAVEPVVNAFTDTYFDEALVKAQGAAERYARGTARPLEGISLAVKDQRAVRDSRR